jgi:hypothetical protein
MYFGTWCFVHRVIAQHTKYEVPSTKHKVQKHEIVKSPGRVVGQGFSVGILGGVLEAGLPREWEWNSSPPVVVLITTAVIVVASPTAVTVAVSIGVADHS